MKPISNNFKEEISKLGREYSNIIGVYGSNNNSIITEDDRYILTQSDLLLITGAEEGGIQYEITDENIFKVDIIQKSEIFSAIMKELDFESDLNLSVGNVINYKLGLKLGDLTEEEANQEVTRILEKGMKALYKFMYENVENPTQWASSYASTGMSPSSLSALKNGHYITDEEWETLQKYCDTSTTTVTLYPTSPFGINDYTIDTTIDSDYQQYEYIDYNNFIIFEKQFNEDTKHYEFKCYDSMVKTMIMVDDKSDLENTMIANVLNRIAIKCGLEVNIDDDILTEYPNLERIVAVDTFKDTDLTYRDILGMICQACGFNLCVEGIELVFKDILGNVVDTIDDKYLKDINVTFKEKYGPINSLVLSRSDNYDNIYEQDEDSIAINGLHEFKIEDNLLLLGNDREQYISSIFDKINGLEFYINDFESTGICYLDLLDYYNIAIQGNTYKCILLNDEIHIKSGISENIYTEIPEGTITDYTTSSKTDKEVSFIVDKQKGEISAKVSKGDVINEINLDTSGASINAEKISLVGKTIELTSDNIDINSTNFKVNSSGEVQALSLTTGNNVYVGVNQSQSDLTGKGLYFKENTSIRRLVTGNIDILAFNSPSSLSFRINNDTRMGISSGSINIYPDGNNQVAGFSYDSIQFAFDPIIASDERLKNSIKDIDDISWIDKLNVKEYEYNKCKGVKRIGLIAQDYIDKEYSKYFLDKNEDGYYGIRYNDITNALIKYCQELKQEIKELKERIDK